MTRLLEQTLTRRRYRRFLAAAFLLFAVVDLGSHALHGSGFVGDTAWCVTLHYTHPEIDCPHKRDHQRPDKSAFDEVSHLAVLLTRDDLRAESGITYRSEPPVAEPSLFNSRSLEPPSRPPEQA